MADTFVPTTDQIRYRVEHDWAPYGDGSFDRWLVERDRQVAERAWSEGYGSGVHDQRMSHEVYDDEYAPGRVNPYVGDQR